MNSDLMNPRVVRGRSPRARPVFDHLIALTDERGLFEHALHATARPEHGYCVDDVARALVVTCREANPDLVVEHLRRRYLEFVLAAVGPDGTCHNRMDASGNWQDEPSVGDWWGRAVWALGVAATQPSTSGIGARALAGFRLAAQQRSPFHRSMAFAALGAGEVLRIRPHDGAAHDLLHAAGVAVDTSTPADSRDWPWPEPRLRYANGTVAEALLVAGDQLSNAAMLERGLLLLTFLLRLETRDGRLSVTPTVGRGPGDRGPGFDQQPIEVAAIADACATAYRITEDPHWLTGINLAWRWFLGHNDSKTPMFDSATGAGYDGLHRNGRNLNQGAESTLAMLSTAQHARHIQELR
jgi:hypothetical protein